MTESDFATPKLVRNDTKTCTVCGDTALGYNFNAVTCESCKAFFRRNALKEKEFQCPFDRRCEMTLVTRRFCQRCRLDKCLAVGMKKELIMSEEDKEKKKRKIEEKRAIKRSGSHSKPISYRHPTVTSPDSSSNDVYLSASASEPMMEEDTLSCSVEVLLPPLAVIDPLSPPLATFQPPPPPPPPISESQHRSRQLTGFSSSLTPACPSSDTTTVATLDSCPWHQSIGGSHEVMVTSLSSSTMNNLDQNRNVDSQSILTDWSNMRVNIEQENNNSLNNNNEHRTSEIMQDVLRIQNSGPDSIDSVLSEVIKLEFESCTMVSNAFRVGSRQLNDPECAKLNELIVANKGLMAPIDNEIGNIVGENLHFKDVINLTAVAIRRLIKMAKHINAFRNMCQEDQVALLKGGCTEMMILRSVMSYDPDKNSWKIPHSLDLANIKVDVLKEAQGDIYEEHQRFLRTFDPQWRADENIMLILSAVALFTPGRPRVVHQDVVKLEQNSYYYLLRRYLESIYQGCEARSTFLKLIQKMGELHRLNEEHIRVFLNVNPKEVEPLLIEIFDLKHH